MNSSYPASSTKVDSAGEEEGVALLQLKMREKELARELGLRENCCCVGVLLLKRTAAALVRCCSR
jgi:hypothetical protein